MLNRLPWLNSKSAVLERYPLGSGDGALALVKACLQGFGFPRLERTATPARRKAASCLR